MQAKVFLLPLLLHYIFSICNRTSTFSEIGYEFDRACLMEYDHMCFGGPPLATQTIEEADEILRILHEESQIGNYLAISEM